MRLSIWFGILFLAAGIGVSYLADALIGIDAIGTTASIATIISAVLFILFSASMIGIGAALILHWILGFATHSHLKVFILEIVLSFAIFFVGVGAAIMSDNIWTGLHVFFSFVVTSIFLANLSIIHVFGSIAHGMEAAGHFINKKKTQWFTTSSPSRKKRKH